MRIMGTRQLVSADSVGLKIVLDNFINFNEIWIEKMFLNIASGIIDISQSRVVNRSIAN